MLVLTRRKDESIIIGENTEVLIVDIYGKKVRLGIIAPKSIPVHRKEVYQAIQRGKLKEPENKKPS
jgi:carbon storage regulator